MTVHTELLSKVAPVRQMQGAHGAEKPKCTFGVHEASSTGATQKLATGVEFPKKLADRDQAVEEPQAQLGRDPLGRELKKNLQLCASTLDCAPKLLAAVHLLEKLQQRCQPHKDHCFLDALAVANILVSMSVDVDAIIAGMFYVFALDTTASASEIESNFGEEVGYLISRLKSLGEIKFNDHASKEDLQELMAIMAGDTRILIIKLASRLHLMRTISKLRSNDQKKDVANSTMQVYVPMAERIGMQIIKNELQELSFSALSPEVRKSILIRLNVFRDNCMQLIPNIIEDMKAVMERNNLKAKVFGREKTPYSILEKMKRKGISFRQISDIMAFRILVYDVRSCYLALGALHTQYKNVPGHFKDFISVPKSNNYRSLHTVLIGPDQKIIEVQIRTYEMQNFAEYGLAAHGYYKQSHDSRNKEWYRRIQNAFELPNASLMTGSLMAGSFCSTDGVSQSGVRRLFGDRKTSSMFFLGESNSSALGGYDELKNPDTKVPGRFAGTKMLHSDIGLVAPMPRGAGTRKSSAGLGVQAASGRAGSETSGKPTSSTIYLTLQNTRGALTSMAREIAKFDVNIDSIKTIKKTGVGSEVKLDLTAENSAQLSTVLTALKNQHCVSEVSV